MRGQLRDWSTAQVCLAAEFFGVGYVVWVDKVCVVVTVRVVVLTVDVSQA